VANEEKPEISNQNNISAEDLLATLNNIVEEAKDDEDDIILLEEDDEDDYSELHDLFREIEAEVEQGVNIPYSTTVRNKTKEKTAEEIEAENVLELANQSIQKVLDTKGLTAEETAELKRQEKIKKLSMPFKDTSKHKGVAIALASCIILITGITLLIPILFSTTEELDLPVSEENPAIVVSQSEISGSTNLIFISEQRGTYNSRFYLSRMILDNFGTIFYFDNNIDWENYTPTLVDNNGVKYNRILNNIGLLENRVIFEPTNTSARGLVLTITNNITEEEVVFPIELLGDFIRLPINHITTRTTYNLNGTPLTITGGHFSASGITIFYELDNTDTNLSFDGIIFNIGARNAILRNHQEFEIGEGRVLGRIDFEPLQNLSGTGTIIFANPFLTHNINRQINIEPLFSRLPENQIRIPFENGNFVLERIARRSNDFILVMHSANHAGERKEVRFDAVLEILEEDGTEHVLYPTIFSTPIGSDVLFPITESIRSPFETNLNIRSILVGYNSFNVDIDLNNLMPNFNFTDINILNGAQNVFHERGYELSELVTYSLSGNTLFAIYRVMHQNEIITYLVEGTRANEGWIYNVNRY